MRKNAGPLGASAAVATALTVLALLVSATAAASEKRSGADRHLQRSLEGIVERSDGPPGAIAVVERPGGREVFRAGNARANGRGHLTARRWMRIASTSKAVSGAAALSLVSDGVLDLDDTIGQWLPDQPAAWHPVTLAQMLGHTSGLPDFTTQAFGEAVTAAPDDPPPPAALLAFAGDAPLVFPPGSDYRYTNTDNIVVGLIVQAATGEAYAGFLRQRVFGPVGMGRSRLSRELKVPTPVMRGYEYDDAGARDDVTDIIAFGGWAWASGGIVSTPGNLNKFIRAYAGGDFTTGRTRDVQFDFLPGAESDPTGPGKNSAGLSLFRYRTNCGTVYGHTGSITGYTQLIAASRSGRRSLTVSINAQAQDGTPLLGPLRRLERRAVCAALS